MAPQGTYKLLVLDLDGTLTNKQKQITPLTQETLLLAQKNGLKIALASGRPLEGILPIAQQLQLNKYQGYIMAFNGAQIVDCQTKETIYQHFIDPSFYSYLYQKGSTCDFSILSYKDGCIVSEDVTNEYIIYDAKLNNMPLLPADNFLQTVNFPEPKCLIVGDPWKLAVLEEEMKKELKGQLSVYRSEPFFLEIVPMGINKANALSFLLERLHITREEVMACGDGFNDLDLIKYAGLGVAMDNAQDTVKDAADYITGSNEEDGVAHVVNKFYLRK